MAYRLPEYLAKVEMTPNAGVGKVDMTQLYYQQRDQNEALHRLGANINTITQHVQKQEADNIVNREQTDMIDKFTTWYDQSSQEQGSNKVSRFETDAKAHMEQLRKTYADRPDLITRMEDAWQGQYSHYKTQLNHAYQKEVVSEARAIVDDGNTKYLDGIFGLQGSPQEIYRRLGEREQAVDGLVKSMALTADQAQAIKGDLRNKTDVSRAAMALETNVKGGLQALQDPNQFTFLDGKQRSSLINQAQSQIRQEEAQRRAEERAARAERAADFAYNVAPGAAVAIKQYMETGNKGADYEDYRKALFANRDLPAAKTLLKHLNEAEQDMPHVIEARSMSINELGQGIADARDKNAAGKLTAVEQRQLQARESVLGDMMKARGSGDFLGYYASIGKPVATLTPETVSQQTIENRKKWLGVGKDQFGIEPDAFTAQEAKAFRDAFKTGDQTDKQRVAATIASLSTVADESGKVKMDQERLRKNLSMIGSDNPAIIDEMYFRIKGNASGADEMAQGRALLQNTPDKFPSREKLNKGVIEALNEIGFRTIDPYGVDAKRFAASITEKYIGRFGKEGGVVDSVDTSDIKQVAKDYFGVKEFVTMNGQATLPVTPKQTQADFEIMWNNVDREDLKKAAGGADFYTKLGTSMVPLKFEDIKKKGVLRATGEDGEYIIELPRATGGMFNRDKYDVGAPLIAKDQYGQPITLNMRSVLPDVDAKMKARLNNMSWE